MAEELRSACAAGRAKATGAAAHKLKSSSRAVGALGLGELCEMMEQWACPVRSKHNGAAPLLQAEMTAVDEYLGALLSSAPKASELWPDRLLARSATD
ncbi:Hpt domain-containing protein [Roseateles sp. GG27B]